MVRLKADMIVHDGTTSIKFQFQYGAIKSEFVNVQVYAAIIFQFQYGAIKRVILD